jgi:tetratricopeptide (TPR) repeat protein
MKFWLTAITLSALLIPAMGIGPTDTIAPAFSQSVGDAEGSSPAAKKVYDQALAQQRAGNIKEAIQLYSEAIVLNPRLLGAYNNRALAYKTLGKLDKALQDFNEIIEINPNLALAYNNRANTYDDMDQAEKAMSDYTRALSIDPKDEQIYLDRAIAYKKQGKYKEAIADYSKAIELKPTFERAYGSRAMLYQHEGQMDKAIADYTKAIALNPDNPSLYMNRGEAQLLMFKGKDTAEDAKQFLSHAGWGGKQAPYMVLAGYLGYRMINDDAEAFKLLEQASKKCDQTYWSYLVILCLRKEITETQLLRAANNPEKATVVKAYLGWNYLVDNKNKEAKENLTWVKDNADKNTYEYRMAVIGLKRL